MLAVMPIRAATPADAEAIAQVHVESWRHAYQINEVRYIYRLDG